MTLIDKVYGQQCSGNVGDSEKRCKARKQELKAMLAASGDRCRELDTELEELRKQRVLWKEEFDKLSEAVDSYKESITEGE